MHLTLPDKRAYRQTGVEIEQVTFFFKNTAPVNQQITVYQSMLPRRMEIIYYMQDHAPSADVKVGTL